MAQTPQRSLITQYSDGQVVISKIRKKRNTIPIFGANEEYSATLVTSWYDGSPMDDTKADGSVYFKLKALPQGADPDTYGQYVGSYFRVNLPKFGETFLEKDTMQAMRDLSPVEILLLQMGYYKGVKLNGYYAKDDTPSPIEYYLSDTTNLDDGGSVIVVGDVKLEHNFNGEVDARYFGLVCDYSYINNTVYTDNMANISNLVNYMYNINKDIAGSQRVNPKLYFKKSGIYDGYAFDGNIDFKSGYDIICEAPLVKTDTSIGDGYFLKYGESSRTERISNRNCKSKFWAIAKNFMWTGIENFAGIQIHNFVRSEFEFVSVRRFEIGVMAYGNNSALSYSKFKFNELLNNRIQLFVYSWSPTDAVNNGYVTSCEFDFAGIGYDTSIPKDNYDKYGIVLDSLGYIPESNTFRNGVTEYYKSPEKIGLPVWIRHGALNNFYDFRHESNDNAFMRVDNGYSNFADITITSGGELAYPNNPNWNLSMLIDDRTTNKNGGFVRTRDAKNQILGHESNLVYTTGNLPSKTVSYDTDKINVRGVGGVDIISGQTLRYINNYVSGGNTTEATVTSDNYLQIPVNRGLFFDLDVSYMKSFILDVNEDPNRKGSLYFIAYDSTGNSIPWSGNIFGALSSSTNFGTNSCTELNSPYVKTRLRLLTVSSLVKKIRVIYACTMKNPDPLVTEILSKVRSISVFGLYGKWSSGNISPFSDDNNYAFTRPNRFQVGKGQIVINDNLAGNPNAWGWQYTEDGIAETTKWKVLYNGQQATTALLGSVKQATAQVNISQADLVAISTADGSDAGTTQALANAIKAYINANVVPLVNAIKSSQNTELTNQRTAGQQAP